MKILDIVLFVLVIVLVSGLTALRFQSMFVSLDMDRVALDAVRPRSGDLVLFQCNLGISVFSSPWSHVGMVVDTVDGPQVLEILPEKGRPTLTPFRERIARVLARSTSAVALRSVRRKVAAHRVRDALRDLGSLRYGHSYWSEFLNRHLGWLLSVPDDTATTYCSDFVSRVVDQLGVAPRERCLPGDMARDTWNPSSWGPLVRLVDPR